MTAPDHGRFADDAGAYLLGALSELEARAFARHAADCPECRDELDRLGGAVEAVPRSVEQFDAPPTLKRSLMATVKGEARERAGWRHAARRRRFALPRPALAWPRLAWAAAVLVLVGVALGLGLERATRSGSSERVVTGRVDPSKLPGGSARLVLRGGRGAQLRVSGLPVLGGGRVYEVWLEHGGAVRPAGALFAVHRDGSGAAAIPREVRGGDRVLVTRERAGGAARPSEAPVIAARA